MAVGKLEAQSCKGREERTVAVKNISVVTIYICGS